MNTRHMTAYNRPHFCRFSQKWDVYTYIAIIISGFAWTLQGWLLMTEACYETQRMGSIVSNSLHTDLLCNIEQDHSSESLLSPCFVKRRVYAWSCGSGSSCHHPAFRYENLFEGGWHGYSVCAALQRFNGVTRSVLRINFMLLISKTNYYVYICQ